MKYVSFSGEMINSLRQILRGLQTRKGQDTPWRMVSLTGCPLALTPQAAQQKLRQASTNVKHWNVQMNRLMHPIEPGDKRPTTSSSFTGFQPHLLARRDSSLKRLTRWGSQGTRTPSPSSGERQKSLNGGDEAPISASTPQEDKLDPAPEN